MAEDKGKSAEEKRAEEPVTGLAPGQDPATQSGKGQWSGTVQTGAPGVEQAASVPNPAASAQPGADDPKRHGAGRESTGGPIASTGSIGGVPIDVEHQDEAVNVGGQPPQPGAEQVAEVREAMAADRAGAGGEDQRSDAAKSKARSEEKADAAKPGAAKADAGKADAAKPDAAKADAGKQGEAGKDGKPGEDAKGDDSGKGGAGGQGGAGGAGGRPGSGGMGQPRRNS